MYRYVAYYSYHSSPVMKADDVAEDTEKPKKRGRKAK